MNDLFTLSTLNLCLAGGVLWTIRSGKILRCYGKWLLWQPKRVMNNSNILTLPYLGDFGTSTAWGGAESAPPGYFLCSLSYVNQVWYRATMSKKGFKIWKKNFFK